MQLARSVIEAVLGEVAEPLSYEKLDPVGVG